MRLSLVVPAHNEQHRIEPTLRAYRTAFPADIELVVVANECTDDTVGVTRRVAAELGGIQLLEIGESVGKGGAVRSGLALSGGACVGFVDADLATPPEDVIRVLEAAERVGAAMGSRWLPGSRVLGRTPGRDAAGRVFAILVRILLGFGYRDTQCGIKIFQRRFLADYLARSCVNDLAFDVEMLALLRQAGATIEEVPTTWYAKPGSATLGTVPAFAFQGLLMVRSLLLLRWRLRRGRRSGSALLSDRDLAGEAPSSADPKPQRESDYGHP